MLSWNPQRGQKKKSNSTKHQIKTSTNFEMFMKVKVVVKAEEQTNNTGEIAGALGANNQTEEVEKEVIRPKEAVARISVTNSDEQMTIKVVTKRV